MIANVTGGELICSRRAVARDSIVIGKRQEERLNEGRGQSRRCRLQPTKERAANGRIATAQLKSRSTHRQYGCGPDDTLPNTSLNHSIAPVPAFLAWKSRI